MLYIIECIFFSLLICLFAEKTRERERKLIISILRFKKKKKLKSACALDFQAEVFLSDDRLARAAVPSGASTGKRLVFFSSLLLYLILYYSFLVHIMSVYI